MLRTLIMGFGRSGRDLHWRCLKKARLRPDGRRLFENRIGVVEPNAISVPEGELELYRDIADAKGFVPSETVVHVCTPPAQHATALRQAAQAGFTKIMMEKPLATSMAEMDEIVALRDQYRLDILVVANWLSSPVTLRAQSFVTGKTLGALRYLMIEQHKPRMSRSLSNGSHATAFDVELPHQVALALFLAGDPVRVIQASCNDLQHDSKTVRHMGAAHIAMVHPLGVTSLLRSELTSPIRKRVAEIAFEQGTLVAYYPTGSDDGHCWLRTYGHDGRLLDTEIFDDDPLSSCFLEYYRYFAGLGQRPHSDLAFNVKVVSAICDAKRLSDVHLHDARGQAEPTVRAIENLPRLTPVRSV
jgi:predicted dehydrogenase